MAIGANNTLVLPNAYTPLAFLPPTIADQYDTSACIFVACFSAFVCDWLLTMPDDYRILRMTGFSAPNAIYFLSRFGTLAYCLTATIFQAGQVAHCRTILYVSAASFVIAVPATSFLFLFRVRAIWNNSKIITAFFGVLWLGTLATAVFVSLAVNGAHIGTTQRCINTPVQSYASAPIILNAFNDTLVFIAISVRIVTFTCAGDTLAVKCKSFLNGDGLPILSKSLLQTGQAYYLATIGTSIVMSAMVLSPRISPIYRTMLALPNIAMENSMACRVFRGIKLGYIKNGTSSLHGTPIHCNRLRFSPAHDIALHDVSFGGSREGRAMAYPKESSEVSIV